MSAGTKQNSRFDLSAGQKVLEMETQRPNEKCKMCFEILDSKSHLKHPACHDLPHVRLDLLLDHLRKGRRIKLLGQFGPILRSLGMYLEIVAGCQVKLLDLKHVAEDPGVLYEDRVLVGEGEKGLEGGRRWRQGSVARVPGKYT